MTDYETLYAEQDAVCGAPFAEFVRFFDDLTPVRSVLDLGCGQGRDALVAGRRGHRVLGVDLSASGVRQMVQTADSEGLLVTGAANRLERQIAAAVGPPAGDDEDPMLLDDVREHGWHIVLVPEDESSPGWCFTVGLQQTLRHPERVIFGPARHRR